MKILRQDKVRFLIYAGILLVIIGIADDLYIRSLSYLHITLLFLPDIRTEKFKSLKEINLSITFL